MYVGVNNAGGEWRTGLQSGGLTASHIGLKGTEDLGGGTQVFFNLDQAFLADNGARLSEMKVRLSAVKQTSVSAVNTVNCLSAVSTRRISWYLLCTIRRN